MSLSRMATKYGVDCWLKHAGKATTALLEKGGLKNMVVFMENDIPMVQTSEDHAVFWSHTVAINTGFDRVGFPTVPGCS